MEKTITINNEPRLVRPAGAGYDILTDAGWMPVGDDIYEDVVRQYREKLTYSQMCDRFVTHNEENGITSQFSDGHPVLGVIVFKPESWPNSNYNLKERSYVVTSDNKAFVPDLCGASIFGDCLDGLDKGIRLDYYMKAGGWRVDYCYLLD